MLGYGAALSVEWMGVLVHLGLFLLVLAALNGLLLRPLTRVFSAREAATIGRCASALQLITEVQRKEAAYAHKVMEATKVIQAERELLRREGFARATEILHHARQAALQTLTLAKEELQAEAEQARAVLTANADQFGRRIAERILERQLQVKEEGLQQERRQDTPVRKVNS